MGRKIGIITALFLTLIVLWGSGGPVFMEWTAVSEKNIFSIDGGEKNTNFGKNGEPPTDWQMYGYDALNSFNYPGIAPEKPDIVWETNFDARFSASPCVVDEKIFIGGDDFNLYCIDANTGEVIFSHFFPSQITTSPYVIGDLVYVTCNDRKLYAFNWKTETEEWSYTASDFIDSSPILIDGTIYFGTFDGNIYALDVNTHDLKWKYDCGTNFNVTSTAAIKDSSIVFTVYDVTTERGKTICLDAEGFSNGNQGLTGEENTSNTAGDLLWKYETPDRIESSASIMGEKVFFGCNNGNTYCISLLDGSYIWETGSGDSVKATPSPVNSTNSVIFGSRDGYLYNVNADTGAIVWKALVGDTIIASSTIADEKVFVGALNGHFYCFGLHGYPNMTTKKIFELDTGESMWCGCAPVIYNGMIYLACMDGGMANNGKLVAIGSPDIKLYNIIIDDKSPYEGENMDIEAVVKNNGTIPCDMDVEFYYANSNNVIKVLIGTKHITSYPLSTEMVNINWRTVSGLWYIWVKLTNLTPMENVARQADNINRYPDEVSVTPTADEEWNVLMKDALHTSYHSIPVDTSRVEWQTDTGGNLFAPVISKGALIVTSQTGKVAGLDQYDGTEKWVKEFGEPALGPGTIHNDKIFVPFQGFTIRTFALQGGEQQNPGKLLWSRTYSNITDTINTIMAKYGMLFVGTHDGNIFALDEDDGELLWEKNMGSPLDVVPMILEDSLVLAGRGGRLLFLDLFDGETIKAVELQHNYPLPLSYYQGEIYIPFRDGALMSHDPLMNNTRLCTDTGVNFTTNIVQVADNGQKAVGSENGLLIFDNRYNITENVSVEGGISGLLIGSNNRCYFKDEGGTLYAYNTTVGGLGNKILWELELNLSENSGYAIWQGKLFVTTPEGKVYCLGKSNEAPTAIITLPDTQDSYTVMDDIKFSASTSSDPDGDSLYYRWESTVDGLIYEGDSPTFTKKLGGGDHTITLTVDDQRGGWDQASIGLSITGKDLAIKIFTDLGLTCKLEFIGAGELLAERIEGTEGVDGSHIWPVMNISADHGWLGWMELEFNIGNGSPILPVNASPSSLNIYLLDEGTGEWETLNGTELELEQEYIRGNITLPPPNLTITIFGQITSEVVNPGEKNPPRAVAGLDGDIVAGGIVQLDGGASYGDGIPIIDYTWSFIYQGEMVMLHGMEVNFTFKYPGEYNITLNVTDSLNGWNTDTIRIIVRDDGTRNEGGSGGGVWIYVALLIFAIGLFALLMAKEISIRAKQKKMEEDFHKKGKGKKNGEGKNSGEGKKNREKKL